MHWLRSTLLSRASRAAVVAVWLSISLGCAEPPPPVAGVALELDRSTVSLGAPLDLHFRFDVLPDLDAGPTEDYRVFVHFLDERAQVLWTEDHDPPVPTSEWTPGRSIEYSRRVKIPMYPYIGESVIATGLYSPRDGTRLALTGTELDQLAYRVASIRLEPQHESSFVTYGEGWHEAEFSADGRTQWRWTTGRGVLSFRNPNRDSRFVLEFDGRADLFDPDQRLSLVIGDRTIEELEIDTTEVVYVTCEIPAADLGSDDIVNLELRVDRTFTPADIGDGPQDTRELGVRVYYTYFEPL